MKYNIYLEKERERICRRLKELDEKIVIVKKSIDLERKKNKLSARKKTKKMSVPSIPMPSRHSSDRPSYSNPFASKNRKILDNLSSNYNLEKPSPKNEAKYQRNKAIIMLLTAAMLVLWLIYSMTH